jgi:threonine aldolase
MKKFDLRSDTITKPVPAMRAAMAKAEVGDDVYREDPTINQLEDLSAELTGMERALFVSSGSMGNLIPLYLNAGRGTEVITHASSHIIQHEVGAMSAIAGAIPIAVNSPRGLLRSEELEPLIKPRAYDLARTAMIEVENTTGGVCYPLEQLQAIGALAKKYQLKVHMDGARVWNASVATGRSLKEIASVADTITFCLSKGLGAPVGSMLCGTTEFIQEALSLRKMLGGGMRQAGILAAAGLYALENHVERLAEDHENAQKIANTLEKTGWAKLTKEDVETNIIFFSVPGCSGQKTAEVLSSYGILCFGDVEQVRLVTNLDVSAKDTLEICSILESIPVKEFGQ